MKREESDLAPSITNIQSEVNTLKCTVGEMETKAERMGTATVASGWERICSAIG